MKQTTKTLVGTLVLALVAIGAGLLAVSVGKDEEKKAEQKEKSAKLFEIDKAKVREAKLTKAGAVVAAFKRDAQGSAWKVTEPIQTDADDAAVTAIVDKLADLKQKSEIEGLDGKGVGLADEKGAKFVVTVTEEGAKVSTLWVGEDNPFDQSLYVKKGAEALTRVVTAADKAPFEKSLFDLRDKRVAHVANQAEVKKLEVAPEGALPGLKLGLGKGAAKGAVVGAAGTFAYAMEKDGADWKLAVSGAAAGLGDASTADRIVSLVKNLKASAVIEENASEVRLKELGLSFPKFLITLTVQVPGGKETFVRKVSVGQPAPAKGTIAVKTYAKRDDAGTVFEIDNSFVKDIGKDLFELQDKTVVKFDREAVRAIVYETPGKPAIKIARKKEALADGGVGEEDFTLLLPSPGPAKKWKISGNLHALANLKAGAFVEGPKDAKALAKAGLDKPRVVTVLGEKDAVLAKVMVGALNADKKRWFAMAEGGSRIVEIEKGTIDDWAWELLDAAEMPPPPPPPAPPPAPAPGPLSLPPGTGASATPGAAPGAK